MNTSPMSLQSSLINTKTIKSSAPIISSAAAQNEGNPDGFVTFLKILEAIVPVLGGELVDPVLIINKLTLMSSN